MKQSTAAKIEAEQALRATLARIRGEEPACSTGESA